DGRRREENGGPRSVMKACKKHGTAQSPFRRFAVSPFQITLWVTLFALLANAAPAETNRYETRATHDRHGIGKFYLGREIAHVMGHEGADWLERPEREREEGTELLIKTLKFSPGER